MHINDLDDRFQFMKNAYSNSEKAIGEINTAIAGLECANFCLVANGSLARKELTQLSDFDAHVITDATVGESDIAVAKNLWNTAKNASGLCEPGTTSTFSPESVCSINRIVENIGGINDDNIKLTQRMLIILESIPIGYKPTYDSICYTIISRYISESITNHQMGLFLLNDIIRYYRTICVDFEFKTTEEGKNWGLRNIKLVYSRKLIYFAGVLMCAELAQRSWKQKREFCLAMIAKTPVERILHILGPDSLNALELYNNFLIQVSNKNNRKELESVTAEKRNDSDIFVNLKNDGHHFGWLLRAAFTRHYDSTHPIHKAILF